MVTIYFLDTTIWNQPNWAQTRTDAWVPAGKHTWKFKYKVKNETTLRDITMPPEKHDPYKDAYTTSISRDYGWWQRAVLNSVEVYRDSTLYSNRCVYPARYNPNKDNGQGNAVYIVSLLQSKWTAPSDDRLVIVGQPLWMCLYGIYSYFGELLKDKYFNTHYMFVLRSPAIIPISVSRQDFYPFVDWDFVNGVLPWEEYMSEKVKAAWYPQATYQVTTINALVESGPFMPRYTNIPDSTWELLYKYKFSLNGGVHRHTMTMSKTPNINQTMMSPILCTKQYKLETQKNKPQKAYCTSGTSEGALLHKQLLKECQKTSKLIQISNLMTQPLQQKREKYPKSCPLPTKKKKVSKSASSHSAKKKHHKKHQKTYRTSSSSSSSSSTSSKETSCNSSLT